MFAPLLSLLGCAHPQVAESPRPLPPVIAVPGSELAFYDVSGTTAVDVVESLVALAPGDAGIRHAALTQWQVVWRYPADTDAESEAGSPAGACDLDHVDVDVSVLTTFPRWSPPADASPADVGEWTRYSLALAEHETDHVRIIHDLAASLPAVLGSATCADADARGLALLDAIRAASAQLDTETLDGATTGAALAWVSPGA